MILARERSYYDALQRVKPSQKHIQAIIANVAVRASMADPVRCASTASSVSTATAATAPAALHTEEFIPPSIEDITSSLPLIPERIGYLKEIGLDYGWGPTAFVEYLLEHVHVYSATPWWASIILTALIVRLALLKGYIGAADVSARTATIIDLQKPIKARLDAAKAAQDSMAMMQATQDMRALHRQAGIQLWKLAVPLIQVPIGYGTFRLLRGMAALPVPGLEDGGLLWIKDLTISDPYMVLPATTAIAIYYTFKAGGELGNTTMNPQVYKFALYGMPVIGGGFMLLYPACMQLTFGFTALLSLAQSYLLRRPWVREFLGIYPLPKPKKDPIVPAIPLQAYLAPSQTPPVIEVQNGNLKKKVSEFTGAASEFKKSLTGMLKPTIAANTKPPPTSNQAAKAQQLQQKRLRELAQAQFEAQKEKDDSAIGRRKKRGECR